MARDLRVNVRLTADTKNAERNVKSAESSFGSMFKKLAGGVAVAALASKAWRALADTFEESIEAAKVQGDAIADLDATLAKLGPTASSVSQALQAQASELQKVTRFGDEATIAAQAQLAVFTQNEEILKGLTIAAQDFATAQGIDVVAAAQLLGKTLGSSTNALVRYGVEVEGVASSGGRAESIIENLSELFGGRATAAAETYAGAMVQVANAQGDVLERLGQAVTSSEEVVAATNELAASYGNLSTALEGGNNQVATAATLWTKIKKAVVDYATVQVIMGRRTDQVAVATRAQAVAAGELETRLKAEQAAAQSAATAELALAAATTEAETATLALGTALGVATSVDLEGQVLKITAGLDLAAVALGENSREFAVLEEVAREKIDSLRGRIDNLRGGLGDLKVGASEAAGGFEELADTFEVGGDRAAVFGDEVDRLRGRLDEGTRSAATFNAATGGGGVRARSSSSQAAVDAALRAGIRPTSGGRRIRTLDGGSRLLEVI